MRTSVALLAVLFWPVANLSATVHGPTRFCVKDEAPQNVQITKGPRVENVTTDTVVIAWSTNVNASTLVRYGTDQQKMTSTAEEPWGGLTHRVTIRNLQPGTTYYFQAESNQGQGTGTRAVSDILTFSTRGEAN